LADGSLGSAKVVQGRGDDTNGNGNNNGNNNNNNTTDGRIANIEMAIRELADNFNKMQNASRTV